MKENGQFGAITEQGDMGFGFTPINEETDTRKNVADINKKRDKAAKKDK